MCLRCLLGVDTVEKRSFRRRYGLDPDPKFLLFGRFNFRHVFRRFDEVDDVFGVDDVFSNLLGVRGVRI